jgi:transposase
VGEVEAAVAAQLRPLLDESLSVVFYDLTTIRIHGEGTVANDVRAYGLNKETGGIARQFVLGVIQTAEGLPIAHEVHAGNIGEVTTLLPAIEKVIARYALKRVVLVADRGLLSLDNLTAVEALTSANGTPIEYILAVPARRYAEFGECVAASELVDGVGETRWQERRLVIAHDEETAQRQQRARREEIARIETEGQRIAARLDDADAGKPQRGRKSNDRRAYLRFNQLVREAHLSRILKADLAADRFSFDRDEAALAEVEQLDGKLLLVTNVAFTASQVIERYKALADIERGFRVLKSDIEIAPVHHRLPERIRAHALICFLALVLHRVMRQKLKANGAEHSPEAALKILQTIQRHHVRIGDQTLAGINAPSAEQQQLFARLETSTPSMH